MARFFLACLVLTVFTFTDICALQCYDCYYNKPESESKVLDFFLGGIRSISSDHCKLEKPSDIYDINTKTCPPPGDGKVNRCAVVKGKVTAKVLSSLTLKFNTIARKCIAVDSSSADYTLGCHKNPPPSGALGNLLKVINNLADLTFEGNACYYDNLTSGMNRNSVTFSCLMIHIVLVLMISLQ